MGFLKTFVTFGLHLQLSRSAFRDRDTISTALRLCTSGFLRDKVVHIISSKTVDPTGEFGHETFTNYAMFLVWKILAENSSLGH